jgi:deaminated glutathione amidase
MTLPMRVAVAQMNSGPDVEANLEAVTRLVARAAEYGAELVGLPECYAQLGPEREKLAYAEAIEPKGPILARVAALARSHGVYVLAGGHWELGPDADHVFNTSVMLGPEGRVIGAYRKIHLFDVSLRDGTVIEESRTIAPGEGLRVIPMPFGAIGLSICYDLRFPELYRGLVERGANVLAVPSAFTASTGKDHFAVLLRARAIESQCYVLAPAQWGRHYGSRVSHGHACIVDPWGTVIAECSDGEGVAVATIEPSFVEQVRASVPCLRHRRL